MIGNIMILGMAVGIIWYVKKVLKSELSKKPQYLWSAVAVALVLLFSIIIPNIDFIKAPFSPEILGQVINSKSKEPISGATVIIDWYYYFGEFPMHSSVTSTKQVVFTTNATGKFNVPKQLRCLAINLFPLYSRESSGVAIITLHPDYKYGTKTEKFNGVQYIKMTNYSNISEMTKDYNDLIQLADAKAKRGQRDTADVIRKIATEKDIKIKMYFGYKGEQK
ncbi:MAG TPA: hypothetical protein VGJ93_07490 [Desulfuromonadaceae bacterium]|jgi:hypothetical protein